jgi:tRNA threonylcarbamoyladenosine biosynthesis protein TsaB
MIILALETATSRQSVAVFNDQHLLGDLECASGQPLTPQLIPTINRLLTSVSLRVSDLEGLAVSMGPGGFTGLRVGLATITALRLALNIPLVGVPTLEGLAWNHPCPDLPLLSTVSIRPGMVYWGIFRWENDQVVCLKEPQIGDFFTVCESVFEPTLVLGDGWVQNRDALPFNSGLLIEGPATALWPSAKGIGRAGRVLLKNGAFLPQGSTPQYIQPSYAEMPKTKNCLPAG